MKIREKLLAKVQELDLEMASLFEKLSEFSQEELSKKLDPQTWSPIQVVQHLLLSEQLSLGYCKKKLSFEPSLKKASLKTWMNGQIVVWALRSPFKFKAPSAVKTDQSSQDVSLESLKSEWVQSRAELVEFITTVSDKYIDKEVYKHPLGLRISLPAMLDFYKGHFRRHRKQIFRRL